MTTHLKISKLTIGGFKSIDSETQTIPFGNVTVLIGANGAGKSNLVHFFKMLNYMMSGAFQHFIGEQGYADSLLYLGAKKTPMITAVLEFCADSITNKYSFKLAHAAGDTLIFADEEIEYQLEGEKHVKINLGSGHRETGLLNETGQGGKVEKIIHGLLSRCTVFQFHDTSAASRIRSQGYIDDNRYLRSDGGNLAAFLYVMKQNDKTKRYYQRIVRHIQQIFPQFDGFQLAPSAANNNYIRLNWQEKGRNYLFGPHQLSDGSLRFMALTALLLQPPDTLPNVIILDEPELGLHPAAITSLSGMIRTACKNCQVILSTQSPGLVDEFEPGETIIVERDKDMGRSIFKKLDENTLSDWLERFSLSELWDKNVLGGRP